MEATNDERAEFLKEFRALLLKHNVLISFDVSPCSDTYGLYDERIVLTKRPEHGFKDVEWLSVEGWSIDASDVPESR